MPTPGKLFEEAVYKHILKMDPNARVMFDHNVPDIHSGEPRQADLWIEMSVPGVGPFKILVSCKDHKKRQGSIAIETMIAQVESYGANYGILYSSSGFTKPALKKARIKKIRCCSLLSDGSPEVPPDIFCEIFIAYSTFRIGIENQLEFPVGTKWGDLLAVRTIDLGNPSVADLLEQISIRFREHGLDDDLFSTAKLTEQPRGVTLSIGASPSLPPFKIAVSLDWSWYRGLREVFETTASSNQTDEYVEGSLETSIPVTHLPGEGWEKCERPTGDSKLLRLLTSPLALVPAAGLNRSAGEWKIAEHPVIAFGPAATLEQALLNSDQEAQIPTFAGNTRVNLKQRFGPTKPVSITPVASNPKFTKRKRKSR